MRAVWLGGWASHLACWGAGIERGMPGMDHTYLDTHSLIDSKGQPVLPGEAGGNELLREEFLSEVDVGIAWSMGTLYLFRWLEIAKPNPKVLPRWICCNPILHFCHPDYGWSPRVLSRMRRHLEKSSEKVLNDFWNIMSQGGEAKELREPWLQQGKGYPVESLRKGLDFLEHVSVEEEALKPYRERLVFLSATKDAVAPVPPSLQGNGYSLRSVEASHLLPLTQPQQLLECLTLP